MILVALVATLPALADNKPNVSLDTSETLFGVLTAINTCGYDQELNASDPLRGQIRSEVRKAVDTTPGAQETLTPLCQFYREHQPPDGSRDLAQYVSLALYLQDPPTFKVKQTELPPEAAGVSGILAFLPAFY